MFVSSFDVFMVYSVDLGTLLFPSSMTTLHALRAHGELFSRLKQGISLPDTFMTG